MCCNALRVLQLFFRQMRDENFAVVDISTIFAPTNVERFGLIATTIKNR